MKTIVIALLSWGLRRLSDKNLRRLGGAIGVEAQ